MKSADSDATGLDAVTHASERASKFVGCLLGGALGDAVGLPTERIGPRRIEKLFPDLDGPRLLCRRGMISDDTEHALFTARALFFARGNTEDFARLLQRELKMWLLALPAGAGAATIKAAARSWRGVPPEACGVDSAGNGPAMRAPIIGLYAGSDDALLCALNRASSRLTHIDARAEAGALCVALATRDAAAGVEVLESAARIVDAVRAWMSASSTCSAEVETLLRDVRRAARAAHEKVACWDFARSVVGVDFEKKGVSGFIAHTVPVALHAAWREDDAREVILNAVRCGGDTDSVAAIAGAIAGARVGAAHLPQEWVGALVEWPRGVAFMEQAAQVLVASREAGSATEIEWPRAHLASIFARNVFFLGVVLAHGLRRLAPPY